MSLRRLESSPGTDVIKTPFLPPAVKDVIGGLLMIVFVIAEVGLLNCLQYKLNVWEQVKIGAEWLNNPAGISTTTLTLGALACALAARGRYVYRANHVADNNSSS